jgi:hypothetical protein
MHICLAHQSPHKCLIFPVISSLFGVLPIHAPDNIRELASHQHDELINNPGRARDEGHQPSRREGETPQTGPNATQVKMPEIQQSIALSKVHLWANPARPEIIKTRARHGSALHFLMTFVSYNPSQECAQYTLQSLPIHALPAA